MFNHRKRFDLCAPALIAAVAIAGAALVSPEAVRAQTLDLSGANVTLPDAPLFPSPWLSGSANITNSGAAATVSEGGGTAATAIYSGAIADGAGAVALTHTSGFTVLSGANSYSGATTISAGTLQAGSANGFSPNSVFTVGPSSGSTATLDVNGFNSTIGGLSGYGSVVNNGATAATLSVNTSSNTQFNGSVADGARQLALTLTGSGTFVLAPTSANGPGNTYSGVTTISSGATLQLGNGSYTSLLIPAIGPGAIVNNGTLSFIQGYNNYYSLNNAISGSGAVVMNRTASGTAPPGTAPGFQEAGTVTLAGSNSYTGGTSVNGVGNSSFFFPSQLLFASPGALPGALTLTNAGVAGTTYALDQAFLNRITLSSLGVVALGANSGLGGDSPSNANSLNFDTPALRSVTLGSACTGSGFLCQSNYSGALTPNGSSTGQGVYRVGGGNGVLNVMTNLADQNGPTSLVAGAVPGPTGSTLTFGATTLSGTNTYSNGTTVASGILQFQSPAAIPNAGAPTITIQPYAIAAAGYAIDQQFLNSITSASQGTAALAVDSSNNLDFNTPGLATVSLGAVGERTYSGTISPTVNPANKLGTFYLDSGAYQTNTNVSTLTVSSVLSDANALGGTNQLIVNAAGSTNNAGFVFLTNNESYTGQTFVDQGALALGNSMLTDVSHSNGNLLNSPSVQLGDNAALYFMEASAVTFDAVIAGPLGSVLQSGPGTVTLTRQETYGGATYIIYSTLALGAGSSIASSSAVVLYGYGGTLDISGGGAQTVQNLFSLPNSQVNLGANTLTIGVPGSAYLNPELYNVNNAANSNGVQPAFVGTITGTGGLVFQGASTYVLGGTSTYSGMTTIAAGTLQAGAVNAFSPYSSFNPQAGATLDLAGYNQTIGSLRGAGTVTNSIATSPATLTLGGDNSSTTFTGLITDSGANGALTIAKTGTGTFTIAGANSYTGGTTVASGVLDIQNANAVGTGAVALFGGATMVLDGNGLNLKNSVVLSSATDPTVTVNSGNTDTMSGVISGPGALTINGGGTLILTNNNTYTGATSLTAGTLTVNGSIASSSLTTVSGGATLNGTGSVGPLTLLGGAVFAPGSGTPGSSMNVVGNLTFNTGSIFQTQLNSSTASFVNVTGSASLTGGGVQAFYTPGSYLARQYLIVGTAGGLGGTTFAGLAGTNIPAGFKESLSYTTNNAYLNLTANLGGGPTGVGPTGVGPSLLPTNQQNVANAINAYFNAGGLLPPGFVNLFGLSGTALQGSMAALSGEAPTGAQQTAYRATNQFLSLMLDPFAPGREDPTQQLCAEDVAPLAARRPQRAENCTLRISRLGFAPTMTAWGTSFGGYNQLAGNPTGVGSHDLSTNVFGVAAGVDYRLAPQSVVGFALSGGGAGWGLSQGLGSARSDFMQVGLYGSQRFGDAYASAAFAFSNHWMSTQRSAVGTDALTGNFTAQDYGGRFETGYDFATPIGRLTPYTAAQAQSFVMPGFSESDATGGGFGLIYQGRSATDTRLEAGLRADQALGVFGDTTLVWRSRLAYAHDWVSDPTLLAAFELLPSAGFTVEGALPVKNAGLVSSGLELRIAHGATLFTKFEGEFSVHGEAYVGSAGLRYNW
jgi:autotransporter-associated beta strand protein